MANETNFDLDPIETREWLDALQAVLPMMVQKERCFSFEATS